MPWCEPCSRYFAPSALSSDGSCPSCGASVEASSHVVKATAPSLQQLSKMSGEKAPWHFRLLMVMLIAYLGWRLIAPFVD